MFTRPLADLTRCAIHTQTTKSLSLEQCIKAYSAAGVRNISVWRQALAPLGPRLAARMLGDAGMHVPSLVRGGFFCALEREDRARAIDENRRCIDEAQQIGGEMVVMVPGAAPGIPLDEARKQVAEGIAGILPHAQSAGVKLALEPLHPMYAADKSCINRLAEARAACELLPHPNLGIALDVYHVWWDPDLQAQIRWAGENGKLFGVHVCDWRVDTRDLLCDRGLMGEGCIDLRKIRGWIENAGFTGPYEVEIFSNTYWAQDQDDYIRRICRAFLEHV